MQESIITKGIDFKGFKVDGFQEVLTNEAKVFLLELHEKFNQKRLKLLEDRVIKQVYFDAGNFPSFQKRQKILENLIGFVQHYLKTC